jgi:pimeloyl-ACP methyl ester carboxylesterase
VAAKAWGPATGPPVLALHGWLDNANTFDRLAPPLAAAGLRVICIDFPGHGKSAHRSPDAVYAFTDYVYYAWALAKQLKWKVSFVVRVLILSSLPSYGPSYSQRVFRVSP